MKKSRIASSLGVHVLLVTLVTTCFSTIASALSSDPNKVPPCSGIRYDPAFWGSCELVNCQIDLAGGAGIPPGFVLATKSFRMLLTGPLDPLGDPIQAHFLGSEELGLFIEEVGQIVRGTGHLGTTCSSDFPSRPPIVKDNIIGNDKTWLSGNQQTNSPNTIRRSVAVIGSNEDAPGWATGTSSLGYVFETIDIPVDIDSLFILLQADAIGVDADGGIVDYFSIYLGGSNILNFDLETIVPGEMYGYEYVVPDELKGKSLPLDRLLTNHSDNYSEVWSSDFFYISSAVPTPAVEIEKLTNGNDADGPNDSDVPRILPGDFVTWTYQVTNTGEVALSEAEIVVTDNQPGVTPVGPGDSILSPGETWIYTATGEAIDLTDPPAGVSEPGCNDNRNTYVNIGSVQVDAGGETASDSDPSHYCNPGNADIDIRKQTEDADTRTFPSGSDVTFEIVVTNDGAVDLHNVAVSDANTPACDNNIGFLAAGSSVKYYCTELNVTNSFENVASVVGESSEGILVGDDDPSTVDINNPPDCSQAVASLDTLWPPNHEFVPVSVLGVTDPDGDPFTNTIDSIFQDEPGNGQGDGNTSPDGTGVGTDTASVRAERAGNRNGRVYTIGFTATDDKDAECSGEVKVSVPKSRGKKGAAVDDGPIYDSTTP